ncbi:MAG: NUDIX hydrolase [Melioribacteraceae bacterium]|jgi:predicted NUDIX family NTP pyrophosphohydrolase|nr:NUDIX hydrolase [Melioribacteraceae bacterium]
MKIFNQSGVIPYRKYKNVIEVLLITTRKGNWTIPKGIIEDDHTPQESALKESVEEAGVWGIVSEIKVGSYKYKKWGGTCNVKVYTMEVTKVYTKWEEDHFRERLWVPVEKIKKMIKKKKLVELINNAFDKRSIP